MAEKESALPEDIEAAHEMIRELRKENAAKRVANKAVDEAFAGFSENERGWLLERIALLGEDTDAGALEFRDMAQALLKEKFYEGLELPASEKEETEEEEETVTKKDAEGLTLEQLQKLLDDREAAAEAKRLEAEQAKQAAAHDEEVEGVFLEIEALGFPRDSIAFQLMLTRAAKLVSEDKPVDFAELAPAVRNAAVALGEELPEPPAEGKPEGEAEEEALFPSTANITGVGGVPSGNAEEDWVEAAKAKGATSSDLAVMARERMEQRLGL